MKLWRILILVLSGVMIVSGCRSSKGGGKTAYRGNASEMPNYAADYSGEEYDAMGNDLAAEARRWLGTPYRYGGRDRNGTDCSGLVMELFRTVCAIKIPRTTVEQKAYCTIVARNKARAGDLVFFGTGKGSGQVSHVGLYIGKGEMIHASSSRGVMVSRVDAGYWGERFRSIGRIDGAYASWASTDRGKGASKQKNGGKPANDRQRIPAPFEVPSEIPSGAGVVPVPVAEIAYDRLPVQGASVQAQATAPAVAVTVAASGGDATGAEPKTVPVQVAEVQSDPEHSIDLLDMIINQKADSIFSNSFMD